MTTALLQRERNDVSPIPLDPFTRDIPGSSSPCAVLSSEFAGGRVLYGGGRGKVVEEHRGICSL